MPVQRSKQEAGGRGHSLCKPARGWVSLRGDPGNSTVMPSGRETRQRPRQGEDGLPSLYSLFHFLRFVLRVDLTKQHNNQKQSQHEKHHQGRGTVIGCDPLCAGPRGEGSSGPGGLAPHQDLRALLCPGWVCLSLCLFLTLRLCTCAMWDV